MLASSAVDHGFISGVMVRMLASSAVDRGFIGGITVSMLALSAVDRANSAIFQLYHGENKLIFNETNTVSWIFIVLAH
jgi:hypothetical protein